MSCNSSTASDNPPPTGGCTGTEPNHPNNSYCNPNPPVCDGSEPNHPNNPNCVLTGTEGLTLVDAESVEVNKWMDLATGGVGTGTGWEVSAVSYPASGLTPGSSIVGTVDDLLWLDGMNNSFSFNMKVGSDKNLYLFTVSGDTYNFTFDLLFVKTVKVDGKDVKYSVTASEVKYIGNGTAIPSGTVYSGSNGDGSVYYNVDSKLPIATKTILGSGDVKIYMIVKTFDGFNLTDSGKNVIRIK